MCSLRQQLEFAKEESNARSELQQKITGQHKELKELYQVTHHSQIIMYIIVSIIEKELV